LLTRPIGPAAERNAQHQNGPRRVENLKGGVSTHEKQEFGGKKRDPKTRRRMPKEGKLGEKPDQKRKTIRIGVAEKRATNSKSKETDGFVQGGKNFNQS